MPARGTLNKEIKTMGDLRDFINNILGDIEDDYKISFDDCMYDIKVNASCDISYSERALSIDCDVTEYPLFTRH